MNSQSGFVGYFFHHRTLIGFIAGTLTTVSFLPQVLYVYRSKKTQDISFSMYFLFFLGVLTWLIYGLLLRSTPIVFFNAITLVLSGAILIAKCVF